MLPGSQKLSELRINPNPSGQSWLRPPVISRILAPLSLVSPSAVGLPALALSAVQPTAIPGRSHWAVSKLSSASCSLSATSLCNHFSSAHISNWKPLKAKLLSHVGVPSCPPTWNALHGLKQKFLQKALEDPSPAHKEAVAAHGTSASTENVGHRFGLSESCCLMFPKASWLRAPSSRHQIPSHIPDQKNCVHNCVLRVTWSIQVYCKENQEVIFYTFIVCVCVHIHIHIHTHTWRSVYVGHISRLHHCCHPSVVRGALRERAAKGTSEALALLPPARAFGSVHQSTSPMTDNEQSCVSSQVQKMNEPGDAKDLWIEKSNAWIKTRNPSPFPPQKRIVYSGT